MSFQVSFESIKFNVGISRREREGKVRFRSVVPGDSGKGRKGTRADSAQFGARNSVVRVSEVERRVREGM